MKKILLGVSSLTLILGVAVGPSLAGAAGTLTQTNENTGNNSDNLNRSRIRERQRQEVKNMAKAANKLKLDAKTGKNQSNQNTTGGSLTSGMVDVTADATNDLNQNVALPSPLPPLDVDVDQSNTDTGNNSDNKNIVRVNQRTKQVVENNATARNVVDVKANTGENELNKNTDAGDVTSGDVIVSFTTNNTLN